MWQDSIHTEVSENLKSKAINASFWAMIDNIMNLGGSFIISLVLARLLNPADYGLIGLTTFFIAFFGVFIRSGFMLSLVRDQNAGQKDYSTVFYFNLIVCLISYAVLFFISPLIAKFFKIPDLCSVLRVLGVSLIIDGVSVVQTAIRVKQVNYKIQAVISITGTTIGGAAAILMAYNGFGVWSLVFQVIIRSSVNTVLFWITSKWRPALMFSREHLKKHWAYSSSLLRNDITIVLFDNLYNLTIGKFYSTDFLGYYTRAKNFLDVASTGITRVLSNGISFPILCRLQDSPVELKNKFFHFMRLIVFISSSIILLFVAVSDSLIPVIIGDKWEESIHYIKLLALSSFLYPVNVFNISIARVIGRTDIFANAILFQRVMIVPAVIVGIFTSIDIMIICANFAAVLSWIYNMIKVRTLLSVKLAAQIKMQVKVIYVPLIVSILTFCLYIILRDQASDAVILLLQLIFASVSFIILSKVMKVKEYSELKSIVINKLKRK